MVQVPKVGALFGAHLNLRTLMDRERTNNEWVVSLGCKVALVAEVASLSVEEARYTRYAE
ncbi:hypothetical protein A9Q99_13025 [Gammaproteobacteria bacterium 45_16_T64]|nr:hypothetical protein A9Q99_13025 [Gammaproteobacteria bacterium 45_16_T64]